MRALKTVLKRDSKLPHARLTNVPKLTMETRDASDLPFWAGSRKVSQKALGLGSLKALATREERCCCCVL